MVLLVIIAVLLLGFAVALVTAAVLEPRVRRSENLLQSISADGGRYTNSDESFVFWSKGTGAFITESGKTTFNGCAQAAEPTTK